MKLTMFQKDLLICLDSGARLKWHKADQMYCITFNHGARIEPQRYSPADVGSLIANDLLDVSFELTAKGRSLIDNTNRDVISIPD